MISDFERRLAQANRLETPFIDAFNKHCSTHRIFKFGIEATQLRDLHPYIYAANDPTSQFIRYLPDSALVCIAGSGGGPRPALLEFKVHDTPIYSPHLFSAIQSEHNKNNGGQPDLTEMVDVFAVEQDSLEVYRRMAEKDVSVVIVGWQSHRSVDLHPVRAQFVQDVVVCSNYRPKPNPQSPGSGTVIANTHFGSFTPLAKFFHENYGVSKELVSKVIEAVI